MRRDADRLRLLATFAVAGLGHVGAVALAGSSRAASLHATPAAPIDVTVAVDETASPEPSNDDQPPGALRIRSDELDADLETQSRTERSAHARVSRSSVDPRADPRTATPHAATSAPVPDAIVATPVHADAAEDIAPLAPGSEPAPTSDAPSSSGAVGDRAASDRRGSADAHAAVVRKPRLVAEREPCRGVFPSRAACDRGTVTLAVDVTESGTTAAPRIVSEEPTGQGFASAARQCSANLHFYPASDVEGRPVASSSVVRLRFER